MGVVPCGHCSPRPIANLGLVCGRGQPPKLTRRRAIGLGAGLLAGALLTPPTRASATTDSTGPGRAPGSDSVLDQLRPAINPRAAWAGDRPVVGPIVPEDDVRFLLVHHTASTNDYGPDDVVDQIRGFYAFHTGPEKGWPDVAYNFFVDRFGGIWEARAGSLAGPVRGDATGGSQGHALLCSLIGDHSVEPVTDQARDSLVALLAWLAEWHQIPTEPGTTVDFVSRGSNLWPAGEVVQATTLSGHRDMSNTSCPGDFVYDLLDVELPQEVSDRRVSAATASSTSSSTSTSTTTSTSGPTSPSAPTTGAATTTEPAPVEPEERSDADPGEAAGPVDDGVAADWVGPAAVATGVVAAGAAAVATVQHRRRSLDDENGHPADRGG